MSAPSGSSSNRQLTRGFTSATLLNNAPTSRAYSASASTSASSSNPLTYNGMMPVSQDDRQLLCSLVESQQYGPAVKAVLDRGWNMETYQPILQDYVIKKNREIHTICHQHYQEMLSGIDGLLSVKVDLNELRTSLTTFNNDLQGSGEILLENLEILNKNRRIRCAINEAKHVLNECLSLILLTKKAKNQMKLKKFFIALKTLDQLQRKYLPRFADYQFANQLERQIPVMITHITSSVENEFFSWLKSISSKSFQMGELALVELDEKIKIVEKKRTQKRKLIMKGRINLLDDEDDEDRRSSDEDDDDDDDEYSLLSSNFYNDMSDAQDGYLEKVPINFSPVFQCLHIYETLHMTEQFQSLYKDKRRQQALQSTQLEKLLSSPSTFLDNYTDYLSHLCGFFLVEIYILKSGNELLSRSEVDSIWDSVTNQIKSILNEQFSKFITNPFDFLQIKYLLVLFMKIMEQHGHFDIIPLREFLMQQKDQFEALLLTRLKQDINKIFESEKYEPLGIMDAGEYNHFVLAFGLSDPSIHVEFPASMPFSISVPLIVKVMKNYVMDMAQYLQDLSSSSAVFTTSAAANSSTNASSAAAATSTSPSSFATFELSVPLVASVDKALRSIVNLSLLEYLENGGHTGNGGSIHISQAVQFSLNAMTLQESGCAFLEKYIFSWIESASRGGSSRRNVLDLEGSSPTAAGTTPTSTILLHSARECFHQTRVRCEDLIFELMDDKIDQFMSLLSNFDWAPNQVSPAANDYVSDLIAYLETTFSCMVFMPDAIREAVHFTSCRHIASNFMNLLLNTVKKFNVLAIYNLNHDVALLEEFAQRCPINNLVETFSEIRQLIDLFLSGDVESILDPMIRDSQYPHLSAAKLIKVLDKFKDPSLFANTPNELKKVKRKNVDNVIKRLQKP